MPALKKKRRLWRPLTLAALLLSMNQANAEVSIEAAGAAPELIDALRAVLRLQKETCEAPFWRIRRLAERAADDVSPILRAYGYYRAQVEHRVRSTEGCWQANIEITLGDRVTIRDRSITVEGPAGEDPAFADLINELPLGPGQPLDHGSYEQIKSRLRELALERGYLDFELTRKELRVHPDETVADILIKARSGPRYRFGTLHIDQPILEPDFALRLADDPTGEPFTTSRVNALNRNLSDSGYFKRVEVITQREQRNEGEVPVDIRATPAARHAWRTGVGYATDTGPRGSLRYDNRYLNPRGHHFESELRLSPVQSGLTADYVIPGRHPRKQSYSLGAGIVHKDTDGAESDSVSLIGRHIIRSEAWIQTRFVEWQYESSTVGDDETDTHLLMPGVSLERLRADDPLRTRRGYRINLETRGASTLLGSSVTFAKLRGSLKGIYRIGEGGRFTGRVDAGTTLGDTLGELPASLRFFAGGDNSVRGYKYESLGPRDADGEPTGGRHLLTGSLEYEHPVHGDDIWLAAFVDAGNAFNNDDFTVRHGAGFGARWYSPVGRLRLDIAFPDDTRDDDWRLHFGLGADL